MFDTPVLRMSLERVSRDFHLHIATHHKEVQEFVEANLDKAIDEFLAKEATAIIDSIIRDAFKKAVQDKLHSYNITQRVSSIMESAVNKYIEDYIYRTDFTSDAENVLKNLSTWKLLKKVLEE